MSMFENIKNMAGLMGQAGEIKEKMQQVQDSLARKTVEGESGAGAVIVTMNGKFEIIGIAFDRPLIATLAGDGSEADQQMIEDLTVAACTAAHQKAQKLIAEEMSQVTGGLNIPGLDKMLGGM